MNFTISGESYSFTLEVDGNGNLTLFTANEGDDIYDCSIQMIARTDPGTPVCCTPSGCTSGPCWTSPSIG